MYAHVGQSFASRAYDVLIVGAGRMGAALAWQLRQRAPHLSLLLAEEGGLPNEEGATILASGVWHSDVPDEQRERAERTRALLGERLQPCGVLTLSEQGGVPPSVPYPASLADAAVLPGLRLDPRGGVYSPASVTLDAGQQAVRLGADLMLNVRCELRGGGQVALHRLSVTNTHQVVVDHTVTVTAAQVVIASGAAGPHLIENGLGQPTRHRQAYRQLPRLNVPSGPDSPVVRACGFVLRPHSGGYVVTPPILHPDPWGYQPVGGRLAGVPVGLRREVVDSLLPHLEALPALASEALVVGRSSADIPGAWLALPEGGWPRWDRLDEQHVLLLGGPHADLTGLAVAEELAEALAQG
ncbi:FAD-dependent oxidoreductase [Deinococcus sonorensis]|uniref:FAD-dependent oxidoreductase n=1 Tax=Deinococcus sonorensis KR-87 TaxID=694439 RepID=A0AAU7UF55_9DEIO